jgi:CheY-like chemotaxis protein
LIESRFTLVPKMKLRSADNLLIVEDNLTLRETLTEILTDTGCRITAAANGMEAFLLLAQRPPTDLPKAVLLDLMMPVMDGWEFRRLMLENINWATIPVIVTTALPLPECRLSVLEPAAVVSKPYDIGNLLRLLEPYCWHSGSASAPAASEDEAEFFLCSVAEAFALADAGFVEAGYQLLLEGTVTHEGCEPPALAGLWADALRRFRSRFGVRLH